MSVRSYGNMVYEKGLKIWGYDLIDESTREQARQLTSLPFIHGDPALMPDAHGGRGSTIGSVIPTYRAIIPAAVGVDIGCGMQAQQTNLTAKDLPDNLFQIRSDIEAAVPHGRSDHGGPNDVGRHQGHLRDFGLFAWGTLAPGYRDLLERHPKMENQAGGAHMGTLGTGNHFIELCLDENDAVWIMLHSGSRGPGNRVGSYFINLAKEQMQAWFIDLPSADLAYLPEFHPLFKDYIEAVQWAQRFAKFNRGVMMARTVEAIRKSIPHIGRDSRSEDVVDCHHNYVAKENHFGKNVWLTRKGAIRARLGDLGIIPGSMGAKSYIVRGKGSKLSLNSCSHGAGRTMSRTQASKTISLEQHAADTRGVECRKDASVLDESPGAYKDIDRVMAAQSDLVEIVHTLRQVVCVKG